MRLRIIQPFLILSLLFSLGIWGLAANIEKGPYLIFPGDNTQMTVLYQLDATAACTLEWGTDTNYSAGSVQTSEYGSDHQHKYVVTNLTPGTKYFYRVNVSGAYYTGTYYAAPAASAQNLKFLAYGDTRSYPADHDAICAQMIDSYTTDSGYQTFTVLVGDYVNNGDSESDWTNEFFDRSQSNATEMQANLPIMGSMGNHEYSGVLYQKYWPYPFESGTRYFSYDYGPAHVIVLDQYVSYTPGSAQYTWLENDLAAAEKPWIFMVFHEPGWSAGGHSNNSTVQQYIQPLCLQYAVKLVFVGHNHYYARCEVDGIHHITTGGGGAPLYAPNTGADYLVASAQSYNFCEIDIQGDQLSFTARDDNGTIIDSFTTDNSIPLSLPWSDGFESGDFSAGGWIASNKTTVENDPYSGSYAARTNSTSSLTKNISTLGFTDIRVSYARKTSGMDPGDYLLVEWFDGTDWNTLETTLDTSYVYKSFLLPAGAANNAQFQLRFAGNAKNREYGFIDQVEITGTEL